MRNGVVFQRPHWARTTRANDFSSWPTPAARDGKDLSTTKAYLSARLRHSPSMATTLLMSGRLWHEVAPMYAAAMGFPSQWNVGVYS